MKLQEIPPVRYSIAIPIPIAFDSDSDFDFDRDSDLDRDSIHTMTGKNTLILFAATPMLHYGIL